ncbi:hypothetical protein [Maricaulis sp.]|uniref:hypothetical protein n=1 Tax=Maricaulis sp. TaxID=1486257 RepID=UPI003A93A93B
MTQRSLAKYFPDIRQADTDRDRLQVADLVLALVEKELQALESQDDDLTYLIEVLRCGVQRALGDSDIPADLLLVSEPHGRTH